jgi:alkylation response protein AidB-like acyl-CoA dehydrogenase
MNNLESFVGTAGNKIDKKLFEKLGSKDYFKHAVDRDIGGLGDRFEDLHDAYLDLGKKSYNSSLILSLNAHLWGGVFPLINFGTDQQKQDYLKDSMTGEKIGGHAITEKIAGSDIYGTQTMVKEVANGYLLNGTKSYITNAPIADYLIIYAKDNIGISAFIVSREDKNCEFLDTINMSCFAAAPIGQVKLDNCFLPKHRLLGSRESGGQMLQRSLELERSLTFSGIIGIMTWQFEQIKNHVKNKMFGDLPLSSYQVINHKVVDIYFRLQTAKTLLLDCVRLKDNGKRITMTSTMVKNCISDFFVENSTNIAHILGALGFERGIHESLIHDALGCRLIAGSTEIQKNIAAALLGLRSK